MAEHLGHVQVERTDAVALLEGEMGVAGGLADNVQRSALALGDLTHVVDMFLLYEQAHALLALVGDDLFRREGLVADGQFGHVNQSATFFHQLREAVHVPGRTVVVDGHHGVDFLFAECTHEVVRAFLHLGVGALNGVQLDAAGIAAGVHRRDGAAAEADAVVVAAHHYDFVAFLRSPFQAVALRAVAHAAGKHDHLVVAVLLAVLLMLESEHGTGDERLAELVAEVARTVACLDEDLLRTLIEPFAHGQQLLPRQGASLVVAGVAGHVNRGAGDGP